MTAKDVWVGRFVLSAIMAFGLAVSGCSSSDGKDGAQGPEGPEGPAGPAGPEGPEGPPGMGPDAIDAAIAASKVESCGTCHQGAGDEHQAIYDNYVDESALELTLNSVNSTLVAPGNYTVELSFSITENGLPFVDAAGLPSLDQKRFYAVQYNSATGQYLNGNQRLRESNAVPVLGSPGDYLLTQTEFPYAPENPEAPFDGAHVYGYIADGALLEVDHGPGSEIPAGSHVHLYEDVSNAAIAYGTGQADDPNAYESGANVAGCENCHGTPYYKHGYRAAQVEGLPDFAACKSCHYDDRSGGHEEWQYMVDQPLNWATAGLPEAEVETLYAYTATILNDTHMSHGMEFPYPQSMSTCNTCHEDNLDAPDGVLADSNFTWETCVSCHSVRGTDAWPTEEPEKYAQNLRAPALQYLWTEANQLALHMGLGPGDACTTCHGASASSFDEYHTGYVKNIYDADGNRYAEDPDNIVSIDNVSLSGNLLTVDFSVTNAAIVPELLVSLYGWDTKNFIIPSHQRDGSTDCTRRGDPAGCDMEYTPESSGGSAHPLFTENTGSVAGDWSVTLDLAAYQAVQTDDIPTLIADGVVHKLEVTVTPELELTVDGDEVEVVLNAVDATLDIATNQPVDDYFKGDNATVDTDKCNVCHDSLASTFHDGSGRAGDGIQVCKNCHNPTFPGSHLEMTSRSIDSYTHAIHTFQDFDTDDTFEEFDPVLATRYNQHINHVFPNFTIRNCEACHVDGTYNVPDQSQSLPGALSRSYDVATWYMFDEDGLAVEDPAGRNIGTVAEAVTGPASRACGACHRSRLVNDDAAADLAALDGHTQVNGTYVPNDPDDEVLFGVIDKIMSMFE